MKLSFYNHLFETENNKYIYNVLSTAIAKLDDKTYSAIKESSIEQIDSETLDNLTTSGFVVNDETNERDNYQYFYDNLRYVDSAGTLQLMFLPTYDCNLRCTYCYEGNCKPKEIITDNNVEAVIKFVKNQVVENLKVTPIKRIIISLYGGEPMMGKKALIRLCEGIDEIANEYSLETLYDMTTNLTLLDDSMIELIRKYFISVQVSIDGTKEEHDKRRITIDHRGTFDLIINNLKKLKDAGLKGQVTIRINIDDNSINNVKDLFKNLLEYSDDVYFGILTSYKGFNDSYDGKCIEENSYIASELTNKIHTIYKENNLTIPQRFGKKSPCSINSRNKFIVDCYLNVYKCEMLVNHKKCMVGNIDENGILHTNDNFFKQMNFSPFMFDKCRDCKMLPACASGCPAKPYINNGLNDGNICYTECIINEDSLTTYLKDYVKLVYGD